MNAIPPAASGTLWTLPFKVLTVLNVFIFLGFDTLLPTLTLYLESHGHSRDAIGQIFSVFIVSAILARSLAPRLVLSFRPIVLIRFGLIICALAVAGYYLALTAASASLARFFHGLGFGLTSTLVTAVAAQIIPVNRMAQGIGFLGLGVILTLSVGPYVGVWLMENMGFLALFLTVSSFYVLGLIWTLALPDIRLPAPLDGRKPKMVFISQAALVPSALMFLTGIAVSAGVVYLALYLKEINLPYAGQFFGCSTIGIILARIFAGPLQDRFGHRVVIPPALGCMFASVLIITRSDSFSLLFLASILWGLSTGSLFPCLQALAFSSTPPQIRTAVAASLFNSLDVGFGVGSVVFGLVAEMANSYHAVYWAAAANALFFLSFYLVYYILANPKEKTVNAP
ncbi:MAG: MFS transporter [Deltaproteobacteria bacterium]|jgi:MFS family permease|nr:MFS transporter [Deltaproteobacteria bacterium]